MSKIDFARQLPKVIGDYDDRFSRSEVKDGNKIRALRWVDLIADADLNDDNVIPLKR